jgi:hypothetical protein
MRTSVRFNLNDNNHPLPSSYSSLFQSRPKLIHVFLATYLVFFVITNSVTLILLATTRCLHCTHNSSIAGSPLEQRINYKQFCLGYMDDGGATKLKIHPPINELQHYLQTNFTFDPYKINATVPHFITLCNSFEGNCLTYSSREFCQVLSSLIEFD